MESEWAAARALDGDAAEEEQLGSTDDLAAAAAGPATAAEVSNTWDAADAGLQAWAGCGMGVAGEVEEVGGGQQEG